MEGRNKRNEEIMTLKQKEKEIKEVARLIGVREEEILPIIDINEEDSQRIKGATSPEEARKPPRSKAEMWALARQEELSLEAAQKATAEELRKLSFTTPLQCEAMEIIVKKLLQEKEIKEVVTLLRITEKEILPIIDIEEEDFQRIKGATSPEEARKICRAALPRSKAERLALARQEELSLEAAQKATSKEELIEAYFGAPVFSEALELAVKKLLQVV